MRPGDLVTCRQTRDGTPLFAEHPSVGEYCAYVMMHGQVAVVLELLTDTDMVRVLYDGRVLTTYSCGLDPLED